MKKSSSWKHQERLYEEKEFEWGPEEPPGDGYRRIGGRVFILKPVK